MVTSYVHDRPVRGLAADLSDSGLRMSSVSMLAPPPGLVIGVELELPDVDESIWASGQICYRKDDRGALAFSPAPGADTGPSVSGIGVRFLAMARSQARVLRDFCIEMRRKNLGSLLARIRASS